MFCKSNRLQLVTAKMTSSLRYDPKTVEMSNLFLNESKELNKLSYSMHTGLRFHCAFTVLVLRGTMLKKQTKGPRLNSVAAEG